MPYFNPAVIHVADISQGRVRPRGCRCWCWLATLIAAAFFYLTFAGIIPLCGA